MVGTAQAGLFPPYENFDLISSSFTRKSHLQGLPISAACGLIAAENEPHRIEASMNEHVQTATTELLFNPLAPEFIRDPYPSYERLRTTDPMHVTTFGAFVASR